MIIGLAVLEYVKAIQISECVTTATKASHMTQEAFHFDR